MIKHLNNQDTIVQPQGATIDIDTKHTISNTTNSYLML